MTVSVYVEIADSQGNPIGPIAGEFTLDYTLNCAPGAVGVMELTVSPAIPPSWLVPDARLSPFRSIDGRPPYRDNGAVFLLETFKYSSSSTFMRAYHANTLATRRYILYNSGTTFANKTATFADNLLKAFWRENAGSLIDSSRDGVDTYADISALVQVEANRSQGPSVSMSGARDPLDSVMTRICDAASTAGTYMTYEIIALSDTLLELRTYINARGIDHRINTPTPVILGESRGNLENATLTVDYHDEVTFAVAGGQGQQDERIIASILDTSRAAVSALHRIEHFFDMSNVTSPTVIADDVNAALRSGRPTILGGGTLIDTPRTTRGIHYDLGDIIQFESPITRELIDVRLDLIHEHYDATGSSQGQSLTAHQKTVQRSIAGLRGL